MLELNIKLVPRSAIAPLGFNHRREVLICVAIVRLTLGRQRKVEH